MNLGKAAARGALAVAVAFTSGCTIVVNPPAVPPPPQQAAATTPLPSSARPVVSATGTGGSSKASPPSKTSASAPATPALRRYANVRFGYSGAYPDGWMLGPESDNRDGAVISDGQGATVAYWGSNDVEVDPAQRLADAEEQYPASTLSVRRASETSLVLSGLEADGQTVFYYREWIGGGSFNAMLWRYPASKKKAIDPLVSQAAHTFRPGNLASYH